MRCNTSRLNFEFKIDDIYTFMSNTIFRFFSLYITLALYKWTHWLNPLWRPQSSLKWGHQMQSFFSHFCPNSICTQHLFSKSYLSTTSVFGHRIFQIKFTPNNGVNSTYFRKDFKVKSNWHEVSTDGRKFWNSSSIQTIQKMFWYHKGTIPNANQYSC